MSLKSIENRLLRLLDVSRTMIDLAYYALLYNDEAIAEEVLKLEEEVDDLHTDFELEVLKLRGSGDEKGILGLVRLGLSAEAISDAAASIADLIVRDIQPHPILHLVFHETEETVTLIKVGSGSELENKSLGDLELDEMGINVLAVKRIGGRWIKDPPDSFILNPGDLIMASGYHDSIEELREMASSPSTEDERK